ncbi:hypothetical protein ABVB72_23285 [Rhizobium nepotum]|uniref:hypothetical protein n=1 Tax=Rhizobium nepotum TaxID=1035271 RepID=UPI00336A6150
MIFGPDGHAEENETTYSQARALKGSVLLAGAGSIRGLGAAITRRFGRDGRPVVMAGRNEEKLLAAVAEIKADGVDAIRW